MIYATYTADLTTQMTIGHSPIEFDSFKDIHSLGKRLIVSEGGAEESFLRNSAPNSALDKLYTSMQEDQIIEKECDLTCVNDRLNVRQNFDRVDPGYVADSSTF